MKKLFFAVLLTAIAFSSNAQDTRFGVKAGVDFASVKVKWTNPVTGNSETTSASETGFFVGGFVELGLTESFAIQPEVLYVAIKDSNMLNIPVLGKYSFGAISVMAGPGFSYLMDAEEDKFKVNIDLGASYDITEDIDASARYSIGMGDVSVSGLFVGVGYKF